MSIYRRRDQPAFDASDIRRLHDARAKPLAAPVADAAQWAGARRAQPADMLLPMTRRWIDSLPPSVRPFVLIKSYPRIANRIAASWPQPAEFNACMDDLLVDHRGGRQGFPPMIQIELAALRTHYGLSIPDLVVQRAADWR
jgi:hypothetical protein